MTTTTVIERSANVLGGAPVFRGTRVPVQTLIDYLEAGDRIDDFLADFPSVTRDQALQLLELAKDAKRRIEIKGSSATNSRPWLGPGHP